MRSRVRTGAGQPAALPVSAAAVVAVVALAALAATVAGCAPSPGDRGLPVVGPARVDVDTPALRRMKAQAGIAPCRPGRDAGSELPRITLPCLGGGPAVALDTLRGPLVMPVWASWCGPCRRELPLYQRLSREYAGRLAVVGIDFTDPQTEAAMSLLRETGARFPQLADPGGDLVGSPGFGRMTKLPLAAFVARDGSVTVEVVAIETYQQLTRLVADRLGVTR